MWIIYVCACIPLAQQCHGNPSDFWNTNTLACACWAMRMNGMFSPSEYTKDMLSIIVPDAAIVEQIKSIQTTVHRVDE